MLKIKVTGGVALSTALLAGTAFGADGQLDLSFGTNGLGRAGVEDVLGGTRAAVAVADGKVLVCDTRQTLTSTNYDFFITRLRADGALDPTFGANGSTTLDFNQNKDYCSGIALQADGKIVVAGTESITQAFGSGYSMFVVARLDANGAPDPSFGGGTGKVQVEFSTGSSSAAGVALQSDGKIVIAGSARTGDAANEMDFAVIRLLADGSLDPEFDGDGKATAGFYDSFSYDVGTAVALDAQGRIIVAGSANSATGIARFLANGQLDASFDNDGLLDQASSTPPSVSGDGLIVQRDGKIVVVGGNGHIAALRLLDNGEPDTTFGTSGVVTVPFNLSANPVEVASGIVEQSDGKLILVGKAQYGDTNAYKAVAARLDTFGQLDASFGSEGKVVLEFGLSELNSQWFSAVGLSSGRIIAAGSAIVASGEMDMDDIVVRLQNDLLFTDSFQ